MIDPLMWPARGVKTLRGLQAQRDADVLASGNIFKLATAVAIAVFGIVSLIPFATVIGPHV